MKYPFRHDVRITKSEAVKFIAELVYPDMEQVAARKKVRDRMSYPTKQGLLPETLSFDLGELFKWAITNTDWNKPLLQVEGLPIAASHLSANLVLPAMTGEGFGHQVITDPVALEDAYTRLLIESHQLRKENQSLHDAIRLLQTECDSWRQKDGERRRKCSESGSRPKGR